MPICMHASPGIQWRSFPGYFPGWRGSRTQVAVQLSPLVEPLLGLPLSPDLLFALSIIEASIPSIAGS